MRTTQRMLLCTGFLLVAGSAAFSQSPDLPATLNNLRSSDERIGLDAARNLPQVWQTSPDLTSLVNQLPVFLSSPDPHVRLAVLATFEQIGPLHPEQAPTIAKSKQTLMEAAKDPLEDIRQYALAVLGMALEPPDEDLKKAVLSGLKDPGHKVRRIALGIVSFKKFKDPEIVTAALAQPSAWPGDLSQTIDALGEAAPTNPRVIGCSSADYTAILNTRNISP